MSAKGLAVLAAHGVAKSPSLSLLNLSGKTGVLFCVVVHAACCGTFVVGVAVRVWWGLCGQRCGQMQHMALLSSAILMRCQTCITNEGESRLEGGGAGREAGMMMAAGARVAYLVAWWLWVCALVCGVRVCTL